MGKFAVFVPILFLIFLTLKLTNLIDWSWFWVLSPLIAVALFYAIACIIGVALTMRHLGKID